MNTTYRQQELAWYMKNGKHGESRIAVDSNGDRYVIGDFSWNKTNPNKKEFIERDSEFDLETTKLTKDQEE